jgi:ATP-binding cassette subfamily F protein 3
VEGEDPTYRFSFPQIEELGVHGPILSLRDVTFGYDKSKMVISNVNLRIDQDSRIAILGNVLRVNKSQ